MAQLSLSSTLSLSDYDVTTFGTLDWSTVADAGTGAGSFSPVNYKSGGPGLLVSITPAGGGYGFYDDDRVKSWSGGANSPSSGSDDYAVYAERYDSGPTQAKYTVVANADTTARVLRIYLGAYASATVITATLSDASAGPASDSSTFNTGAGVFLGGYVDITYQAGSGAQTLSVVVECVTPQDPANYGNVTLQALAFQLVSSSNGAARHYYAQQM